MSLLQTDHAASSRRRRTPLRDLTTKITKGTTPTSVGGRFVDDGINYIKVETISDSGSLEHDRLAHIDEESDGLLQRSRLAANDVLFSIAGAIGRTYLVKPDDLPANVNQALAIVRFNPQLVHPEYGFYAMRDAVFRAEASGRIVQCAQANVNLEQLSKSTICAPALEVQRRIASVLSAYDDLIENNRRRMKLLEDAARLLYEEWFVRLRFPGHERVRIKSGVPERWERKRIGDIADCVGGGTPSTKVPAYWEDGTITWVTPTDVTRNQHFVLLDTEKKITEAGLNNSSAKLVPPHAVLMTSRASVGFFALAGREVCTNQGFISIVPHDATYSTYLLFHLSERVDEIRAMGSGSTYPEVSRSKFRELPVVTPSTRLVVDFDEQAAVMLGQIRVLKLQNHKLRAARDLLLPRLMSGGIELAVPHGR